MPTQYDVLKERLSKSSEINITVTGRKSGRAISIPIWFVLRGRRTLSSARAGVGYAVVHERAEEPLDSDRCVRRKS